MGGGDVSLLMGVSLAAVSIPGRAGCLELFSLQGNLTRGISKTIKAMQEASP
jgi:hypothetical protein